MTTALLDHTGIKEVWSETDVLQEAVMHHTWKFIESLGWTYHILFGSSFKTTRREHGQLLMRVGWLLHETAQSGPDAFLEQLTELLVEAKLLS